MKRQIKKWTLRLFVTGIVISGLLIMIILNPIFTYANKTQYKNLTIYHNKPIHPALTTTLDQAINLLKTSEFYDAQFEMDICLNDGSTYPTLMKTIRGQAFAWGFYNKVVMQGNTNYTNNHVELHGYAWNFPQLLAHEMIHCLQYHQLGLWNSNPVANIPTWKWEGYAEYVSRQHKDQINLSKNIEKLAKTDQNLWEVKFEDGTITARDYYKDWLLVQYCMNIRKMSYHQILKDTTSKEQVEKEMMTWYSNLN